MAGPSAVGLQAWERRLLSSPPSPPLTNLAGECQQGRETHQELFQGASWQLGQEEEGKWEGKLERLIVALEGSVQQDRIQKRQPKN